MYTDLLACLTSLSAFTAATARLSAQLHPEQQQQPQHSQPSGAAGIRLLPQAPVQVLIICTLLGPVLLQLFLLLRKPHLYQKHRTTLCAANRLLRLAGVFANTCTAVGRLPILRSLAARLQDAGEHPSMTLSVLVLQPIQFFAQAALFVLPLQHVIVLQMATTAACVWGWARFTPCMLSHPALAPAATAALLAAGQRACTRLQAAADSLQVVSAVLPEGVLVPYQPACAAAAALLTLQCFGMLAVLFVLPVGAVCMTESWLRAQQQQQAAAQQAASMQQQPTAAASRTGSSSSRGTSGSAPGASLHQVRDENSSSGRSSSRRAGSLAGFNDGVFGLPLPGLHLCLLAPVVLALTWSLSELLPQVWDEPECPFHSPATATSGSAAPGAVRT